MSDLLDLLRSVELETVWTSFDTGVDLRAEVERIESSLSDGSASAEEQLALLFAPTGALQEVAMRSGFHDEYLRLANRHDKFATRPRSNMAVEATPAPAGNDEFWRERRVCFLTTSRPDGSPHLVPVGVTFDPEAGVARVISSAGSKKVRNVRAAGPDGAQAAVSQVDGRRWCTLEGTAVVKDDAESVAEAERRYAERYRQPRPNPERVVIEITVTRVLGNTRPSGW